MKYKIKYKYIKIKNIINNNGIYIISKFVRFNYY